MFFQVSSVKLLFEEFKIAETASFSRTIQKDRSLGRLYKKITDFVYPALRKNPFAGPHIKRLKGELPGYYRYKIGSYRLFYRIDKDKVIVFIINLTSRETAYK